MSAIYMADSNAAQVQIPSIVSCAVTPLFVAIRFWSRVRVSSLGLDDWTILGSMVFCLAVSALMLVSCNYGFGKHISTLSPADKKMALKLFYVAQAFYKININLTKASILLLYLRIFVQKSFRIVCSIMLAIVLAYLIASTAAAIFQCTPIVRAWDKSVPGICINITTNWYANAGFSIATDLIILLIPMPLVYSLRLQPNQKAGLMFVFALGGFVVVTSVLRLTTLDLSSTSPDTTYEITSSLWTVIESNVGIICACLPMCRLALHVVFPSLFPISDKGNKSTSSGKFSHAGTSKNDWMPPSVNDIQLAEVHVSRNDSEEYILHPTEPLSPLTNKKPEVIHKVTQFTVKYDDVEACGGDVVRPGSRR